jgi:hypothetical protein
MVQTGNLFQNFSNMRIYKYLILILIAANPFLIKAQVGFGTNLPDPSAVIELFSGNKGLLIPRLNLISTNSLSPTTAPANSLLISNTATTGSSPYNVTPGFYFFNTTYNNWFRLGEEGNDAWKLAGNANTNSGTNFIGTTNSQNIVFKRNNIWAGTINISSHNGMSFGINSLNTTLTGSDNIAIGYSVLTNNTTANYGVAFGTEALVSTTDGAQNIALGYKSLTKNISGVFNVGLGSNALYNNLESSNLAIGTESLYGNQNGNHNYAFGINSLRENISGSINIAIGTSALNKNTTEGQNVAIGYESLYNNNGLGNVGIGRASLYANTSGQYNEAIGINAMQNNVGGIYNTAIGTESLKKNMFGSFNTTLGYLAGQNLDNSGMANVALGANTDFASTTASNQLNIANNIFGTDLTTTDITSISSSAKIGIGIAQPTSTLHIEGSVSTTVKTLTSGTVSDTDYTVLVGGNISLPAAGTGNTGRIYNLINADGGTYTVTANFRQNTVTLPTYTLNNVDGNKGVVVQSNGTNWIILEKN